MAGPTRTFPKLVSIPQKTGAVEYPLGPHLPTCYPHTLGSQPSHGALPAARACGVLAGHRVNRPDGRPAAALPLASPARPSGPQPVA